MFPTKLLTIFGCNAIAKIPPKSAPIRTVGNAGIFLNAIIKTVCNGTNDRIEILKLLTIVDWIRSKPSRFCVSTALKPIKRKMQSAISRLGPVVQIM